MVINHKEIDMQVDKILHTNLENLGFVYVPIIVSYSDLEKSENMSQTDTVSTIHEQDDKKIVSGKWMLSEEALKEARARSGYKLGQLVSRGWEEFMQSLSPDDIPGAPFTGSNSRADCNTGSYFANNSLYLPFPLFSSNMESVTDANMAITMARMGGIGVIHQFQPIENQVEEIKKVKNASVEAVLLSHEPTGSKRIYQPAVEINNINRDFLNWLNLEDYKITFENEQKRIESIVNSGGKYLVAAATGINNNYMERIDAIIQAGADIIVLDIAHGDSIQMYPALKEVREKYENIILMAGNITTAKAAYHYANAGVNIIKANVGPGFSCTTRKVTGFGVPTITGLYNVVTIANHFGVDVVGDGGVDGPGKAVKYFATGVKGFMMGSLLGGTSDSPLYEERRSTIHIDKIEVWGSASDRAKQEQGKPPWDTPEGRVRLVEDLGLTKNYIAQLITGVQSGLSYAGTSRDGKNSLERLAKHSRWTLQTAPGAYEGQKGL